VNKARLAIVPDHGYAQPNLGPKSKRILLMGRRCKEIDVDKIATKGKKEAIGNSENSTTTIFKKGRPPATIPE
jgi:hypothetical protein